MMVILSGRKNLDHYYNCKGGKREEEEEEEEEEEDRDGTRSVRG